MNIKYVKCGSDAHLYVVESYRIPGDPNPKSRTIKKLGLLSKLKSEHPDLDAYLDNLLDSLRENDNKNKSRVMNVLVEMSPDTPSYAQEYHIGQILLKAIWEDLNLSYFFKYHGSRLIGSGTDTERAMFAFCTEAFASLGTQKDSWDMHNSFMENDLFEIGSVSAVLDFFDDIKEKLVSFLQKKRVSVSSHGMICVIPTVFECISTQSGGVKYVEIPTTALVRVCEDFSVSSIELSSFPSGIGKEDLERVKELGDVLVTNKFITSSNDLVKIREFGIGYIVRGKIKNMPKNIQKEILSHDGYVSVNNDFRYKQQIHSEEIRCGTNDIILKEKQVYTYSQKRLKKERSDRIALSSRYFQVNTDTPVVQRGAEENDADRLFDGYRCLRCSGCNLSAPDIIEASKIAARIEDHIKSIRSILEIKHSVVWNAKRIRGFYAFVFLMIRLVCVAETRVGTISKIKIPHDRIVAALLSAKLVPLDKNGKMWKTVGVNDDFRLISEALGIGQLADISSASELKKMSGFAIKL